MDDNKFSAVVTIVALAGVTIFALFASCVKEMHRGHAEICAGQATMTDF